MSWLPWFSSKKTAMKAAAAAGAHGEDSTRPAGMHEDDHGPAHRKGERIARRERLYGVVRECMVNAGVLSSAYKFKVLSLDSRGRQFLLMVDLAGHDSSTAALAQIESAIAQSAKTRHGIVVKAVYWRRNEQVGAGLLGQPAARKGSEAGPATQTAQAA